MERNRNGILDREAGEGARIRQENKAGGESLLFRKGIPRKPGKGKWLHVPEENDNRSFRGIESMQAPR